VPAEEGLGIVTATLPPIAVIYSSQTIVTDRKRWNLCSDTGRFMQQIGCDG
jgi:hypothetical protein